MDWTSQIGVTSQVSVNVSQACLSSARVISLLIFGPTDAEAGPVWLGTDGRSGG